MGYDAVAISASDVNGGKTFLEQTLHDGFPWISLNLVDQQSHPVAPSHIIKSVNDVKIAIIGLTDNIAVPNDYSIIDFQTPLADLLKGLTHQSDMIILLSNLPGDANKKIASQFPEIDTIISSDRSLGKLAPLVVNNTLIMSGHNNRSA